MGNSHSTSISSSDRTARRQLNQRRRAVHVPEARLRATLFEILGGHVESGVLSDDEADQIVAASSTAKELGYRLANALHSRL